MNQALERWFRNQGGVLDGEGPIHFGDPRREYEASRSGAALSHRSTAGCLILTGTDCLDLLHRTTTGDLKDLAPGRTATTVIQTETARILDHPTLIVLEDRLYMITGPERAESDATWIDRLVIMDDVQVQDASGETGLFDITGPEAAVALNGVIEGAGHLEPGRHCSRKTDAGTTIVTRTGASDFLMIVPDREAVALLEQLVQQRGVTLTGRQASETLRLERGIPAIGRELTEAVNPLEAGLRSSIGFEKGCYTGQEVIARMITYKSVKRVLCSFRMEAEVEPPERGEALDVMKDGVLIGRLTSTAGSPGPDSWIGLGYVKREHVPTEAGGTDVTIQTTSGPVGAVTALPPLRP